MPANTKTPQPNNRDVSARWTPAIARLGWTPIAIYFLDNYSRLSPPIRNAEAMFIIHLMRHKWDANAPYPSFATLAKRMDVTPEAARSYARTLEKKGYLWREGQIGETNKFHLDKLFAALEKLIASESTSQLPPREPAILKPQ